MTLDDETPEEKQAFYEGVRKKVLLESEYHARAAEKAERAALLREVDEKRAAYHARFLRRVLDSGFYDPPKSVVIPPARRGGLRERLALWLAPWLGER